MKTLYYVPMIHTARELGSLQKKFVAEHVRKYGEKKTKEFFREVEKYWKEVEQRVQRTGLFQPSVASTLNIFIDGLPNVDTAMVGKIVQELIHQNIPVYHQIVRKLQNGGAKVHGTEDPERLLQEHRYWLDVCNGKRQDAEFADKILKERDRAIAQRIVAVVPEEENALLFIGRKHDVIIELNKLSTGFRIIHL